MITKQKCYEVGVLKAKCFLELNKIPFPKFVRYKDIDTADIPEHARKVMWHVRGGPAVGSGSGMYVGNGEPKESCVFVNVELSRMPVLAPAMRNWSFPGYKVDRTAVGIVAHEVGHHLERYLQNKKVLRQEHREEWFNLIHSVKKQVSGYEPVPAEAWAETMRLFILNPDLLKQGIYPRYEFVVRVTNLIPSDRRTYKEVLNNHPVYCAAAERWIAAKR